MNDQEAGTSIPEIVPEAHELGGTVLSGPGRGKGLSVQKKIHDDVEQARVQAEKEEADKKKEKEKTPIKSPRKEQPDPRKQAQAEGRRSGKQPAAHRVRIKRAQPASLRQRQENDKKKYKPRIPNALREIRKYQRSGGPLIRRLPFQKLVREITEKHTGGGFR